MRDTRLVLLLVVFLGALLPVAADYAIYHEDEHFYTCGAIQMVQSGDWLTPRDEHAQPRFQKPVLTYWLAAASYRVLGINELSSRLPFMLVGCGVLLLAYGTARMVGGDAKAGWLAMLILACHPQIVFSSIWSMTDILLTFFLLLSTWGFLAVLCFERRESKWYLAAYVGAGLAAATKGLLPLLFLGIVLLAVLLDRRRATLLRSLINVPAMLVGLVLGLAWYVGMIALHGWRVVEGFAADQVGPEKVGGWHGALWLLPMLLVAPAIIMLPWSVVALRLWIGRGRDVSARVPLAVGTPPPSGGAPTTPPVDANLILIRRFLLLWPLAVAIVFSFSRKFMWPYLLPAVPHLAILVADVVIRATPTRAERLLRQALIATVVGVALVLLVFLATALELRATPPALLVGAAIFLLCMLGYAGMQKSGGPSPAAATALSILLIYPTLIAVVRPFASPDQGRQLARRLDQLGLLDGEPVLFVGKLGTAGKLRVCAAGRVWIDRVETFDAAAIADHRVIILPDADAGRLPSGAYRLVSGSRGLRDLSSGDTLRAFLHGELAKELETHRTQMLIAIREDGEKAAL